MTTSSHRRRRLHRIIKESQSDAQEQTGVQAGDLQRLWRVYLTTHRWAVAGMLAALVVWASVPYFFALTHRYMIDGILVPGAGAMIGDHSALLPKFLLGLGLVFGANMLLHTVNLVCNWTVSSSTLKIGRDVALRLRDQLYLKLNTLHLGYYDRTQ